MSNLEKMCIILICRHVYHTQPHLKGITERERANMGHKGTSKLLLR